MCAFCHQPAIRWSETRVARGAPRSGRPARIVKNMGRKVETICKEAEPGRNDLCPRGSRKKYKKCHGAE